MKRFVLFLACSFSVGFTAQKTLHAAKVEETLATVNGEAIYLSDYETNAGNLLDDLRKNSREALTPVQLREVRQKVLDQMVDDLLLLQEARRLKIKVYDKDAKAGVDEIKNRFRKGEDGRPLSEEEAEKTFAVELRRQKLSYGDFEERIRKQLLVIKLVDQNIKAKVAAPKDIEVRDFFKKVQMNDSSATVKGTALSKEEGEEMAKLSQLLKDRTAERVRARHILIKVPPNASLAEKSKALNAINKIKRELDQGEDFADLARKHSQDTESAKKGGDLGYFIRGWMVPAFEKAAFSANIGTLTGPVETEFGYHLILVEEKRAATPLRFEDVEEDLTGYLMQRNFQKNLREYVAGLRTKSEVKIKQDVTANVPDKAGAANGKEGKP